MNMIHAYGVSFKSNTFFEISETEVKNKNVATQLVKEFSDVFFW